jgi:hypothetical protein
VIDLAIGVNPNHAWTATRCLRHCGSLRGRRRLGRLGRRRSRRWSGHLRGCRTGRCHGTWCNHWGRSCRGSLRRCSSFGRIPLLHALMSPASPLFAGGSRISSILALSGRSRRRLSHRDLRRQKPRCNRHPTNRCLHTRSRQTFELRGPITAKSYAIPQFVSFPKCPFSTTMQERHPRGMQEFSP